MSWRPPPGSDPRRREGWALLGVALAALAGAALLYMVDPSGAPWLPPCPLHWSTGWHCPGCGALRGLHALLHGRPRQALTMNSLMVLSLPALGWVYGTRVVRWWRETAPKTAAVHPVWIWGLLTLVLGYWVARNLPWAPFQWLAPRALP